MTKIILNILLFITSFSTLAQSEKEVFSFYDYEVYQDLTNKSFVIKNKKGKVIKKKLKYINYAGNCLQILNKNNKICYLNEEMKKVKFPEEEIIEVCGTVAYYEMKIIEKNNNYLIEFTEDNTVYNEGIKNSIIDTIPKKSIKKIYFANKSSEISFDENFNFPTHIIIEYGDKYGIRYNKSIKYYDSVDVNNPFAIKVRKGKLYGFYGITNEPKYKNLGKFVYNLAKFETKNGNIGYIDFEGNEY